MLTPPNTAIRGIQRVLRQLKQSGKSMAGDWLCLAPSPFPWSISSFSRPSFIRPPQNAQFQLLSLF